MSRDAVKNIPLVFLGVIFVSLTALYLPSAGAGVAAFALYGLAALSLGIEGFQAAGKKRLDDILKIESITGVALQDLGTRVAGWRQLFDTHFLLSMILKTIIAGCATVISQSANEHILFWAYIIGASTAFGAVALFWQNMNFSRHIDAFFDKKTIEARNRAAGKKAADDLLEGGNEGIPEVTARKPLYRRVILKAN